MCQRVFVVMYVSRTCKYVSRILESFKRGVRCGFFPVGFLSSRGLAFLCEGFVCGLCGSYDRSKFQVFFCVDCSGFSYQFCSVWLFNTEYQVLGQSFTSAEGSIVVQAAASSRLAAGRGNFH